MYLILKDNSRAMEEKAGPICGAHPRLLVGWWISGRMLGEEKVYICLT